jgi:hypothetical protein
MGIRLFVLGQRFGMGVISRVEIFSLLIVMVLWVPIGAWGRCPKRVSSTLIFGATVSRRRLSSPSRFLGVLDNVKD